MTRPLTDRLVSFFGACAVTFGLLTAIHTLAASEAAAAAHLAQTAISPICAKG